MGPILLLDHVGAKSGKRRTHPLIYVTDDDENRVIVASKGGVDKHPAWYHNLKAHPRPPPGGRRTAAGPRTRGRGRGARAALGADGRGTSPPTTTTSAAPSAGSR